ncbi:MAG: hypothetical protein ACR2L1_03840, partial [Pyrinomonadaceae bacterium]
MVYDTVREELSAKVSTMEKSSKIELEKAEIISRAEKAKAGTGLNMLPSLRREMPAKFEYPVKSETAPDAEPLAAAAVSKANISKEETPKASSPEAKPPKPQHSAPMLSLSTTKPTTLELMSKQTSPTLVEFQTKNAVLPEWRLQLQNSVRRRSSGGNDGGGTQFQSTGAVSHQAVLVTSGATALKAEAVEDTTPDVSGNPVLAKAMRRIEESRQKFSTEETPQPSPFDAFQQPQQRTFPYAVPNRTLSDSVKTGNSAPTHSYTTKPKPAAILTEVKPEKFDTNKLPPIPAKVVSSFEKRAQENCEDNNIFLKIK